MPRRLMLGLSLAAALSLAAVVIGLIGRAGSRPPVVASPAGARFAGSLMPTGVRAPDFSLRDQSGRRVTMRGLRGHTVIVTFLYTHCHDTCPAEAQQVKIALDRLGHAVPVLAVSVDPAHDTPASARHFLAEQGMTGRMTFVLGSRRQVRPLWRGFAIQPQLPHAEHQSRVTLVDRNGFQRIGFPASETTPEDLAHDIRALERERGVSG